MLGKCQKYMKRPPFYIFPASWYYSIDPGGHGGPGRPGGSGGPRVPGDPGDPRNSRQNLAQKPGPNHAKRILFET